MKQQLPQEPLRLFVSCLWREHGRRASPLCFRSYYWGTWYIEDILRRVPVKSLVRFLCVSKEWQSLISDPAFLQKHISCTGNSHLWKLGRICRSPQRPRLSRDHFSMYTLDSERKQGITSLDNMDRTDVTFRPTIFGSCNGLLLVRTAVSELVFWNPCSGSSRSIRVPCPSMPQDATTIMSGLAYDGESDDYKAVVMILPEYGLDIDHTHVFSHRRNSWTSKDSSDFPFQGAGRSLNGISVNCSPHWVVNHRTESSWGGNALMCFDATKEKFREVPMLPNMVEDLDFAEVGELKGCLSVAVNSTEVNIWTMREYGVVESWTPLHVLRVEPETMFLRPVGYWTSDGREELILQEGGVQLLAVDVRKTNDWRRKVKIIKRFADRGGDIFTIYLESIVSPWGL